MYGFENRRPPVGNIFASAGLHLLTLTRSQAYQTVKHTLQAQNHRFQHL
jgi:hypothetical protein